MSGTGQRGRTDRLTFMNGARKSEAGIDENSRASCDQPLSLDVP